jgi:hypothetical protein
LTPERYAEAYRREVDHFITAVANGTAPSVDKPLVTGIVCCRSGNLIIVR